MQSPLYSLVIGNKAWSSWSLRSWLLLTRFGLPFEEIAVPLRRPDTPERIRAHSPSGAVPALKHGDLVIWDSLAIAEYLAERHPEHAMWPQDATARALARSVSAEMHSGFAAMRRELPMDLLNIHPTPELSERARADIGRVLEIWRFCLGRSGGPFLFGAFSIADAMFAPVVTRLRSYGITPEQFGDDGTATRYGLAIWSLDAMRAWEDGARSELVAQLPNAGSFG